ncbi:MAG: DNA repair protein RecN [Alphaproteobacteria bacterium]|nr:MAG: DNA repair protein RecN [Alphaproteobacteria bacterium]
MLTNLAITNIALISRLNLEFTDGFTALTGETGAGKSLLMDALGLALGNRADMSLIRHGETMAEVTATFRPALTPALAALLEEQGTELEDGTLMLRRQLKGDSSKAWLNGTPIPASVLAQFGALLVDIHAQHGTQALLNPSAQRTLLDNLGGNTTATQATAATYRAWQAAQTEYETVAQQVAQARADAERLSDWHTELTKLAYQPDEETSLQTQRARLVNFTQLQQHLTVADDALNAETGTLATLRAACRGLTAAAQLDASLRPMAERLDIALTDLTDAAHETARAASSLEAEGNLEAIDDRLHALKAAARKHNVSVSELPVALERLAAQTTNLSETEAQLESLEKAAQAAQGVFHAACEVLTAARQKAAQKLQPQLEASLKQLHLPNAQLHVTLTPLPQAQWSASGAEAVELRLAANPGSPAQPIAKVASGGELSRLMLAIKSVLYQGLAPQTVVFDEIDTGLSGAAAASVGVAMASIGTRHQAFAITHHPQVAAAANAHYRIAKQITDSKTTTTLTALDSDSRLEELARLLSGNAVTPQARAAAQALLAEANPQQAAA